MGLLLLTAEDQLQPAILLFWANRRIEGRGREGRAGIVAIAYAPSSPCVAHRAKGPGARVAINFFRVISRRSKRVG